MSKWPGSGEAFEQKIACVILSDSRIEPPERDGNGHWCEKELCHARGAKAAAESPPREAQKLTASLQGFRGENKVKKVPQVLKSCLAGAVEEDCPLLFLIRAWGQPSRSPCATAAWWSCLP